MPIQNSPAMDIYKQLLYSLDAEGRYVLLNTMANQLRYPNSHTHFFSYVMLNLFFDSEDKEFVQEQITRVLLERLIVHRPHPVSNSTIHFQYSNIGTNHNMFFVQCSGDFS
jgi:CCR4-NOT transcription complex subunit 1